MEKLHKLDEFLARSVAMLPRGLSSFFQAITDLGALSITACLAAVMAYIALSSSSLPNNYRFSGALLLAVYGLGMAIKLITRRQRPATIYTSGMRFKHFSFPSGHAYGSLLTYGYLAHFTASWLAYILVGALVFLIGLSRLYLGAHFPSDVLGGWLMGGIALAVVISYANHI